MSNARHRTMFVFKGLKMNARGEKEKERETNGS
jgi:hypothetical protein